MLITFSCKAYENITMLGDIAKQLITLMGHKPTVPGAIIAEDIPHALSRLEAAVGQEEKHKIQSEDDEEPKIQMSVRSFPLMNMLKAAAKHHCNVMWD